MNIYIIGFFVLALIAGNVFGTLQIAADKSNVMIGESVTLTCTDTTKQDVYFFFEKTNTLGECVTAPPGCTPSDASLYTLSMNSSNAAFNLYKLTIKKFTSSMCGLYLCREQASIVASNEVKLGSTAKLSARINLKTESLELETLNCFDQTEAPKIKVSWECQKPDGDWKEIEFKSVDFVPSGSCNPTACDLISYKKLKKVATVEPCTECNITLRANLSFDSIQPESVEISGAPIRDPDQEPLIWAVVALFIVVVLEVIIIIIVCVACICGWGYVALFVWLMRFVNYAIYITVVWSSIMVGLINMESPYCEGSVIPAWCWALAITSLVLSCVEAVLKIFLMIYSCCAEPEPDTFWDKLRHYGQSLIKLHRCGKPMDKTELKDVAVVHAIGTIIGIPLAIVIYCQEPDTKDPGEHSHGQRTGHLDRGGDKRVGVSKQNDEHSKILMSTSGNANQQPRAQPPLPGISKSHQQLDEPHHKKTRGLSSNFEDPNSLPQFEARKHSLAPINATAEGDSDSTARKKKKKKKKKEGSDTARSDED